MLHIDPGTPLDTVAHLLGYGIPASMGLVPVIRSLIHRLTTRKEQPRV